MGFLIVFVGGGIGAALRHGFNLAFARLFGTNYVNNCSYYCHQASAVGLAASVSEAVGEHAESSSFDSFPTRLGCQVGTRGCRWGPSATATRR